MGISGSKKTKTTNEPWGPAQPYILKGLEQSGQVFDQQQPFLNKYSQEAFGAYGRMAPGAEAGIRGSQGLVNDTLAGKFLGGNPYTDAIINKNAGDIRNNVGAAFSSSGRYGSGMFGDTIADNIGEMATNLRYGDYAQERQNQIGAVDQAQGLMAGSQGLLNNAAELPWIGVGALNGNVRNASGGYGTSTSKTSGGLLDKLMSAGTQLGSAAIMASDERVKKNKKKIGEMDDGLGVYSYEYKPELDPTGQPQVGVMAQEVAEKRPDALGPTLDDGTMTVDYGALQQDIPDIPKPMSRFDRLFSVGLDPRTEDGRKALLAQSVLAGGKGIIGQIGRGLLTANQAGYQRTRDEQDMERETSNDDIRRRYMEAQIAKMSAPPAPDLPAIVDEWNYRNSLPDAQRADFDKFRRPVPFQYTDEGITAAGKRQEATSAAAAKYRASSGGGGAPKPRFSTLKVGQQIGGRTYMGGNPSDPKSWR